MIAIVDYGLGNLGSIANMLKKVGAEAVVSSEPAVLASADKLILPGVGAFDHGMKNLMDRNLIPLLNDKVLQGRTPLLGLCLGMQLLTRCSEEGHLPGLGWVDAETVRFKFDETQTRLKIPHMGWNTLKMCQPHPLMAGMADEPQFYFVHSYYVRCMCADSVLAKTNHGCDFVSAVVQDNVMGVQFHPEKSHSFGMQLFRNFAERL